MNKLQYNFYTGLVSWGSFHLRVTYYIKFLFNIKYYIVLVLYTFLALSNDILVNISFNTQVISAQNVCCEKEASSDLTGLEVRRKRFIPRYVKLPWFLVQDIVSGCQCLPLRVWLLLAAYKQMNHLCAAAAPQGVTQLQPGSMDPIHRNHFSGPSIDRRKPTLGTQTQSHNTHTCTYKHTCFCIWGLSLMHQTNLYPKSLPEHRTIKGAAEIV